MNTKRTGWIGEQAVKKDLLIDRGFQVYEPLVDDVGVDLVVDTGKSLKRVQVKTRNQQKRQTTSVEISLRKYVESNIDVIAIYYAPKDIIAYYPYNNEELICLAVDTAKNNQESHRNWFYRYMEFPL
mgnify:CR=1 FL=1